MQICVVVVVYMIPYVNGVQRHGNPMGADTTCRQVATWTPRPGGAAVPGAACSRWRGRTGNTEWLERLFNNLERLA